MYFGGQIPASCKIDLGLEAVIGFIGKKQDKNKTLVLYLSLKILSGGVFLID